MFTAEQGVNGLLDEMAVKIMMIEPGDLSAVGELLEVLEKLDALDEIASRPVLRKMCGFFQSALQDLIMGELPDTGESYQQLTACISRMQEATRNSGDQQALSGFCRHLTAIGFKLDPAQFAVIPQGEIEANGNSIPEFLRDKELLECFIDETGEYLGTIEANVLELEKEPDNCEAVNAIFRAFHTIKGTAGTVSLPEISSLAHSVENLLDEVRGGRIMMNADVIELVLAVDDSLKLMVSHVQDVYENGVAYHPASIDMQLAALNDFLEKKNASPMPEQAFFSEKKSAVENETSPSSSGGLLPDSLKDSDLLSGFISEAFEHLETIELNVLELEQNPDDQEIINNIFRPFHSIKGVSGFLNLTLINKLAHATENLLDDVRNDRLAMNSGIIDIVLGVGDFLRTMIQNLSDVLEQGMEHYQQYDIQDFLERIKICQQNEGVGVRPAQDKLSVPSPNSFSPEIEQLPPSVEELTTEVIPPAATRLFEAVNSAGVSPQKKNIEAAIKVDVNKLDGLVNAVGELVIMQAMVRHNPLIAGLSDPKLNKDFSQLTRITTELQKTAMSMRMVPIRQTFQKMTRLVRDLSKKTGKMVNLVMEGEETEIDRNMVDSIYDPLVHMIRNSVDHGVQPPAERMKKGKPETGTVKLSAYQKGGNIIIEIADDGEGVNTEKIRRKAMERGLIQAGTSCSDHDINNLIFLPGFSTADKITDVSGRGVGMDVVKKSVEKLRGKVELLSTSGEGSLFLMYLPLTLAIIDGIIVRVGSERYIIPTIAIRESMRPRMENYTTVQGKGETLLVRESLLPVIRLYHVFGVKNACTDVSAGIAVVVENEGRQRALLVDELLGKQEVVIKSLGNYMKNIKGVAGGTILGDGRVGLILDLAGLISASEEMGPCDL